MEYKNVMVTGGCGFIGSNFLNYMIKKYPETNFYNVDKLDYCSDRNFIHNQNARNYTFWKCDINDTNFVTHILEEGNIDAIIHFAAQSHVCRSFTESRNFVYDNVAGTHNLLECAKNYGKIKRFIHISTDEVYGENNKENTIFTEESILNPTNPYSASKSAAEMFVKSYYYSYNIPLIITRGNNGYGPNQHEEKLIPHFISLLKSGKKMTLHGEGKSRRNFIHVDDISTAVETILLKGKIGEIYNIGTNNEYSVYDVAKIIYDFIKPNKPFDNCIKLINDRPFNDFNYKIDSSKLRNLGWNDKINFIEGIKKYIENYS